MILWMWSPTGVVSWSGAVALCINEVVCDAPGEVPEWGAQW